MSSEPSFRGPRTCKLYKICRLCRQEKFYQAFSFRSRGGGNRALQPYCKACAPKDSRKRWERSGYAASIKRFYGISYGTVKTLLDQQQSRCAICKETAPETSHYKQKKRLCVDHNHDTGEIRGLLCGTCNLMIGYSRDNPELLREAANYLDRHASLQLVT